MWKHTRGACARMQAKCDSIQEARQLFDKMPATNLVLLTAMMAGYAQNHTKKQLLGGLLVFHQQQKRRYHVFRSTSSRAETVPVGDCRYHIHRTDSNRMLFPIKELNSLKPYSSINLRKPNQNQTGIGQRLFK